MLRCLLCLRAGLFGWFGKAEQVRRSLGNDVRLSDALEVVKVQSRRHRVRLSKHLLDGCDRLASMQHEGCHQVSDLMGCEPLNPCLLSNACKELWTVVKLRLCVVNRLS